MACAAGCVSVKLRLRVSEDAPVPKMEMEAVVGGVHCLLAPEQLHILVEMAKSVGRERSESYHMTH